MKKTTICTLIFSLLFVFAYSQDNTKSQDTLSKFDKFNKKAEALFKIIPAPIVSYSQEAGNVFGLAKFNAFHLSKKDTISQPSKISGSVSFSTTGRVNANINNDLIFKENENLVLTKFRYRKIPEFLLGITNDINLDNLEEVTTDFIQFKTTFMQRVSNNFYVGIGMEIEDYFKIETEPDSFIVEDQVSGINGGTNFGLGATFIFDSRDNRYNAHKGYFIKSSYTFYSKSLGSAYKFNRLELDARAYFKPWLKHVIAIQATTTQVNGDAPFYSLAVLGGENKMRGYYKGALRDKVLLDSQLEYRLPIWNIFGAVGWFGTGRVAPSYKKLAANGFHLSYGAGLRVRVDSNNDINIRIDAGFGPDGVNAVYFNFSEAF